jgi:hypothetical protein
MMTLRHKKAQSALEFLMTYGWAILVILAAVGALAYFGVLDPGRYVPDRCISSIGLTCLGKPNIDAAADTVTFSIANGAGSNIDVDAAAAGAYPWVVTGATCTVDQVCAKGVTSCASTTMSAITPGDEFTVVLACPPVGPDDQIPVGQVKLNIKAVYLNTNSGIQEAATVDVVGRGR